MDSIANINELDALRTLDRAMVFLWVDWSGPARSSLQHVLSLYERWGTEQPGSKVVLLQIDLSEQSGQLWEAMAGWLETESNPHINTLMCGGAGSVLFIRSGKVVLHLISPLSKTVGELMTVMHQVFSENETDFVP